MKRTGILLALTWAFLGAFAHPDTLSPESIRQLHAEQVRMFDMFTQGDTATFQKIAGDDYLTINADGTYMDKAQAMDLIPNFKGSTYKILAQTDRIYQNVALSTGRAKFWFGPLLAADIYFTQTWIFRDDRWQFIAWQGTMTGVPKNYPVFATLITVLVLSGLVWMLIRVFGKKKGPPERRPAL